MLRSLLPALALLLPACVPMGGLGCTDLAAYSVTLSVVDPEGEPLIAEITAFDEAGAEVQVECAGAGDPETCTEWIVGIEVSGDITIHAAADDGCNTGSGEIVVSVPMDAEGCHVVGQAATLTVDEWTDLDCGKG